MIPGAPFTACLPCHLLLETIALYIASCVVAHLAPATIVRRLASISKAHQAARFEEAPASTKHFVVGEVLKGARRTLGVAQK